MTMTQAASTTMTRQQGLTDLEARFIAYLDAKPRTIDTYRKALKQFFTYLADNGITRPERTTIIAYRDSLLAEKKPTTVQTYMVTVRLFFRWAAQEGLYPNVADKVKGAKLDKAHKKDALTANQARTILQAIDRGTLAGKRDYAILALMMGGGLRTIEVSRANLEDLGTAGGSAALYIQGKGRDEKTDYVKLPQPVEAAIRDYLKARGKADGKEALFTSTSNNNAGKALSTRSISGIVKEAMRAAGLDSERLTAHSLRHTAATLNLLNGGSIQETQQLLRHSNIGTTMIYAHNLERAANNSEARIAAAIFA
jgi:integrase/recombinase XerD